MLGIGALVANGICPLVLPASDEPDSKICDRPIIDIDLDLPAACMPKS